LSELIKQSEKDKYLQISKRDNTDVLLVKLFIW